MSDTRLPKDDFVTDYFTDVTARIGGIAPQAYRRPALFLLVAICVGILLGQYNFLSHWSWLVTAVLAVAVAGVIFSGSRLSGSKVIVGITLTLLGLLSLMAFRVVYSRLGVGKNHILSSVEDGSRYRIYGFVSDWPDVREHSTRLTIRVDSTARIVAPERFAKSLQRSGSIMLYINTQTTEFQYADQIVFDGALTSAPQKKNPGGFDYARFLRWKEIYALSYLPHQFGIVRNPEGGFSIGGVTRVVREYILSVFRENLEEQQAALASGFLIGETSGIDDGIYQRFRRSGTLHLLAVSGSNVAVALLVLRLFLWPFPLSRRMRYLTLILGAAFFSFLSHNDPSVVRASVMVSLFLLGRSFQRKIDYHNLIASAGALILLWSPNQLFDVGFQLSFAVTWALILFLPPIHEYFKSYRGTLWYKVLVIPFLIAFVAQLSSAPIALYYFGSAPMNATISNLIIAPAVGVAVAMSLVMLIGSAVLPLLGAFFGSILNVWLNSILWVLEYFGGEGSWQLRTGDFGALHAILALVFVVILGFSLTAVRARRLVVFALVVAPVILLAPSILSSGGAKDTTIILASRGGVCGLISGAEPTLILSDLRERPTSQYQYVIGPALRRLSYSVGVESRINLIQLSADYLTLVNSLTICDSFPQARLTLTSSAERLWRDYQAQYSIVPESYKISYSGEIDSTSVMEALRAVSDSPENRALLVGASMAFQVSTSSKILYLSLAPVKTELAGTISALKSLSQSGGLFRSETPLFVVVDRLDVNTSSLLEKLSHSVKLRVISGRRNHQLQHAADFAQFISYVSETGAVTIVTE